MRYLFILGFLLQLCLGARAETPPAEAAGTGPAPAVATATAESAAAPVSSPAPKRERAQIERIELAEGETAVVYVIPIKQEINPSALFILRRGLKEAIEAQVDLVLLHMDTPGGALDVTLEMMKLLDRFEGRTATFVDENGLSAGAFISAATRDIYFGPTAVVGAAAPVSGGGQEIAQSMREKLLSFLKARVQAIAGGEEHRYRADVVVAMMDSDAVLKVEGEVIKDKGSLLSLTADEAATLYGSPPQPLFSSGTAKNLEDLLNQKYGEGRWERRDFPVTWSVELAQILTSSAVTSLLLGAGLLCLYLEFKTPGLGAFGFIGAALLSVVFFGHHVAGLSGQEPLLIFLLGVVLLAVEIFIFPGTLVAGLTGALLMFGALLWGMADVWPQMDGVGVELSAEMFVRPILLLSTGIGLSLLGLAAVWKFLPKTPLYGNLVLSTGVAGAAPSTVSEEIIGGRPPVGATGRAVTDLHPTGEVEIGGARFDAVVTHGEARAGDSVRVVGCGAFELKVERLSSTP